MRTCLIQYAGGFYTQLLAETFAIHQSHCRKLRYDYWASTVPRTDRHPCWEKCVLMIEAAKKGYQHIVWLDADTVWYGEPLIVPTTVFGMTWHTPDANSEFPHHYNAGAIYVNNAGGQAKEALDLWWNTPTPRVSFIDQGSLNVVIEASPSLATVLDHRWNSVEHIPAYRAENPAVSAWHGLEGNCLREMKEAICKSIRP